jgi:hypothetical protein
VVSPLSLSIANRFPEPWKDVLIQRSVRSGEAHTEMGEESRLRQRGGTVSARAFIVVSERPFEAKHRTSVFPSPSSFVFVAVFA